jgi:hypothetical protein
VDPVDAVVTETGGLLVADYGANKIVEFDSSGAFLRAFGQSGEGPGEFRALYRIAITPTGQVLAYDHGTKEVSYFERTGKFLRRTRLPYFFSQVDRILALPGDTLLVAGVSASTTFPGRDNGVHVFTPEFAHVRSFGGLTPVTGESVRRFWGAGNLSLTRDGLVMYSLRQPYVGYHYTLAGQLVDSIRVNIDLGSGPDKVFLTDSSARGIHYRIDPNVVLTRAMPFVPVRDGWFMSGRSSKAQAMLDLLDGSGRIINSVRLNQGIKGCLATDPVRGMIWCVDLLDDEPRLVRVPFRIR